MIVAIDGPAGAGKSTTAREVAERFGLAYIDTGAMYRAVALAAAERGLCLPHDAAAIIALAHALPIALRERGRRVFIGERDVSAAIRSAAIGQRASEIAALAGVREAMVEQQRRLAEYSQGECGGAVLEGRDIQTVVCPQAEVKIFLTAAPHTRAERRLAQWRAQGSTPDLETAQRDIGVRDARDSAREVAPLRAAPDAVLLSTDDLSPAAVVDRIAEIIQSKRGGYESNCR
ncbi:MAG TPA: (d)CMP kinase [Abditibacteriaceae bacterium]|nr:(d)CMP kinase [Abditibacteriaceae bacterium]